MASVTTNMDINVLANITLESLKVGLNPLTAWSTGFRTEARLNDSAKVFVNSMTLDANDFDVATNNYEDEGDDTTIGIDVQLTDKIKKTAGVDEEDYSKLDISKKLQDLGYAVANEAVKRTYLKLTVANFGAAEVVGAASAFTFDDLIDQEVVADDAGLDVDRTCLLSNAYTANLKKDNLLVATMQQERAPGQTWTFFEDIAGFDILKSSLYKSTAATIAENGVGFYTDSSALGLAMGVPAYTGEGDVDVATVMDESGVGLQLRRHYSRKDGKWYLNAIMLFGTEILRADGLTLLASV
jgi:hypothetical protein